MATYEKLGAFYLGRGYDMNARKPTDEMLLYDAKDLTTHAVCVGMTGSGKTGLCIDLLEEAAIDGIPAIAIDPKGDLGNLMLTFPQLRAQDFRPWIDPGEAQRKGMDADAYAADRAKLWKKGLGEWDQDGERIKRFRDAVDVAIYTPGSSAGLPLTVLRSFAAPRPTPAAASVAFDHEALRERIASAVSGLLALLGLEADPIRSREHILLATILDRAWRAGRDLDIAGLIGAIQSPGFDKVGVVDLESFFPAQDRFGLAMLLNNLLASPGFAGWMEGEPLDVSRLLHTEQGRPRLSILSIAHLSDAERMFFVTILLNEVVAWMRTQPGTSSLRAILYMDEIFGFFPPSAKPPSKTPMLTLLKQARAYGLGVVLATQNPADLDYKGLSNTGTWFLGRLQAERDKLRVLDGLEGAAAATGSAFKRSEMDTLLSGLDRRVFLMNNAHEDGPMLFHTRWALSYLRGPLTRGQIQTLMASRKGVAAPASAPAVAPVHRPVAAQSAGAVTPASWSRSAAPAPVHSAPDSTPARATATPAGPPALAPSIHQCYLPLRASIAAGDRIVYRPALAGHARMHFVRSSARIDYWEEIALFTRLPDDPPADPWDEAECFPDPRPDLDAAPDARGGFSDLPSAAAQVKSYKSWSAALESHLYRNRSTTIWRCKAFKTYSEPGEAERDFRIRLRQGVQERRDLTVEKLRKKYAPKLRTLQDRARRAEDRVERETAQFKQSGLSTALSVGSTVLGALFGRKTASVGTVGRASTAIRRAGATASARGDIDRAKDELASVQEKLALLEEEFAEEIAEVEDKADVDALELEEITFRPRKGDLAVTRLSLAWAPYRVSPDGLAEPAFE